MQSPQHPNNRFPYAQQNTTNQQQQHQNSESSKKAHKKGRVTSFPLLLPTPEQSHRQRSSSLGHCVCSWPGAAVGGAVSTFLPQKWAQTFSFWEKETWHVSHWKYLEFPTKFMKFWLAVRSPVVTNIEKSECNNQVCRSVSVASLNILLLNTRIIFCIETCLL